MKKKQFVITAHMANGESLEIFRPCYESMLDVEKDMKEAIKEGVCTGYQVEVR